MVLVNMLVAVIMEAGSCGDRAGGGDGSSNEMRECQETNGATVEDSLAQMFFNYYSQGATAVPSVKVGNCVPFLAGVKPVSLNYNGLYFLPLVQSK